MNRAHPFPPVGEHNAPGNFTRPMYGTPKAQPPGISGKKWLAIIGAGALMLGGGLFAYHSLHHEEESYALNNDEFARVCQDSKTGNRVDDAECEKEEKNRPSHHSGHYVSAFGWYYLGRSMGGSSIPAVGSKLSGGTTVQPSSGTIYSGVSSKGGNFEDSYKSAKNNSTVSEGKVTSTKSGGKTSSNSGSKSGSNSGSKGGFGGGSKSGGGSSGG